jgi:hypothetical protein
VECIWIEKQKVVLFSKFKKKSNGGCYGKKRLKRKRKKDAYLFVSLKFINISDRFSAIFLEQKRVVHVSFGI